MPDKPGYKAITVRINKGLENDLRAEMQKRGKENTNRFVNRILRGFLKQQRRKEQRLRPQAQTTNITPKPYSTRNT